MTPKTLFLLGVAGQGKETKCPVARSCQPRGLPLYLARRPALIGSLSGTLFV